MPQPTPLFPPFILAATSSNKKVRELVNTESRQTTRQPTTLQPRLRPICPITRPKKAKPNVDVSHNVVFTRLNRRTQDLADSSRELVSQYPELNETVTVKRLSVSSFKLFRARNIFRLRESLAHIYHTSEMLWECQKLLPHLPTIANT